MNGYEHPINTNMTGISLSRCIFDGIFEKYLSKTTGEREGVQSPSGVEE